MNLAMQAINREMIPYRIKLGLLTLNTGLKHGYSIYLPVQGHYLIEVTTVACRSPVPMVA